MRNRGVIGLLPVICASITFLQTFPNVIASSDTPLRNKLLVRHRRQIYLTDPQPVPSYLNRSVIVQQSQQLPEYGPWGPWTESSECSRSCGGGIAYQDRICLDVRFDGSYSCVGASRRYFSCNVEDCPQPSGNFRGEQCARFNSVPYKGKYYSWVPYYNAQNPCELNCTPKGGNFVARLDRRVIDGTRCRDDGSLDVCVDAQCMAVGCDKVLGSTTKEDECRVCGGDGSTCRVVKGIFEEDNFEVGYNDILLIPVGATSIVIKEVQPTNNYLAIRNANEVFYLNGNYRIEFSREIRIAGTIFHYERRQRNQPEVIRARGPTSEVLYVVLLYQGKNFGVNYEYSVPVTTKVQLIDTYTWTLGDYEECSQTCGGGVQYRPVRCIRKSDRDEVNENLCDPIQKPSVNNSCNTHPCPSGWQIGEWSECSHSCGGGTQFRLVFCHQSREGSAVLMPDDLCPEPKPIFMRACNVDSQCPEWVPGEWSECDRTCGNGNRTRKVECFSDGEVREETMCDAEKKPLEFENCTLGPCEGVEWIVSDWSGCDDSCSSNVQSREVHCANEDGMVFPNDACDASKMPELTKPCPKSQVCEAMWHTSEWSECSVKCGHGVQSRVVFCGTWENDAVIKIDDDKCEPEKKFDNIRNCSVESCAGVWFTGPWNRCSVPCGGGERTRKVLCFHEDEVVDSDQCDPDEEPYATESCNMTPCDEDEIMTLGGCKDSKYGCCPDGVTPAGFNDEGCPKMDITSSNNTCEEAEYGCCADNFTLALGPFKKGCPPLGSCNATKYGCCPDGVTAASGADEGCDEADNCTNSTFGCCSDGLTPAAGPELEGCDESQIPCENSTFGCCSDGVSAAVGPDREGCENATTAFPIDVESSGEDCYSQEFGCCPDGLTPASGVDQEGCEGNATDCKTSAFGCCDDGVSYAQGPSKSGCFDDESSGDGDLIISCETTVFGCCPDNVTVAKGYDGEGCFPEDCSNSTFRCCPDNVTSATGPDNAGCFPEDCSNSTFGCCPDNVTSATGPDNAGCFPEDCSNSTFGCCPNNVTSATGPDNEGCFPEDCSNSTFGCCPDNVTSATGPENAGCFPEDCSNSTFGCCPDNITMAEGPNEEGCQPENCQNTTFGCCPDNETIAIGPDYEGCDVLVDCANTTYGCCPDNITVSGPNNEGCDVPVMDCDNTTYGCCPDNTTTASGPDYEGCDNTTDTVEVTTILPEPLSTTPAPECANATYGCCPDEVTTALGNNLEGCCFGMRFGCCPDNKTAALGPTFLGCGCQTYPYGCCPDDITPAQGFNYHGCKCENFRYGCCQDKLTPATGPNFEGCVCHLMQFGCCPDGRTPKINEHGDGCGCDSTRYGCCPDGKTAATSADLSGCPCDTLPYGCCPDGYTPARSSDLRECPCTAQRYGCCLDGRTVARGPNYEGCACDSTRFGCCLDGKTTAQGPNLYGCPCDTMRYGCCADGYTPATGPKYEGCPEVHQPKPKIPTEVCGFPKEPGPCRNYSIVWYFDVSYGRCARFWYGGCDGNGNNFATSEECEDTCVKPEGLEACLLPKATGPCEEKIPLWYYDAGSKNCESFTYGGCLGNNNRFVTKEACEQKCINLQPPVKVDVCSLPKDEGSCDGATIQWYYNKEALRCEQFYYGGCKGNANRFESRRECENSCAASNEVDICHLPQAVGSCTEFRERWFFDYENNKCHRFMYSGCDGNENNFGSFFECEKKCGKETTSDKEPLDLEFQTEFCFLTQDSGPCNLAEVNWYYDSSDGVCKEFYYGGCKGNRNRFKTRKECETSCFQAQDVCSLAVVQGPCSGSFTQWYYDKNQEDCIEFVFSGCQGNANRFNTKESCYQRCRREKLTTPAPLVPDDVCALPQEPGPCLGYYRMWFYDSSDNICKSFVYGGCEGNGNRFEKRIDCEASCIKKSVKVKEPIPVTLPPPRITNEDVCRLPVEPGPCNEAHPRWFYDAQTQNCLPFVFGGCGGNTNRFKSSELCLRFCAGVTATRPDRPIVNVPVTTSTAQPTQCPPSNCGEIRCPYGIEESFDTSGCSSCRCSNPCEVHSCPDGSRCAIDVTRTSQEGIRTEPVCRRVNKPGVCPAITGRFSSSAGDCETRCRDDADCRGDHKCCNNGCAMTCIPPENDLFVPATQAEPAHILPGPNITEGRLGEPAELPCNAAGWPKPTVTWWRETTMLPLSSQRYQQQANYALLISSVVYGDGGEYSCHAHNGIGSGAIFKVTLVIDIQPLSPSGGEEGDFNARDSEPGLIPESVPNLVPKPFDFAPLETRVSLLTNDPTVGAPLQVGCSVKGPSSGMKVTWHHDNELVQESDRKRILSNHTLLITKAEVADSGEYKCSAEYQNSYSTSSISIAVKDAPRDDSCIDNPQFSNCEVIVRNSYCNNKFYGKFCCASCMKAGLLQTPPQA